LLPVLTPSTGSDTGVEGAWHLADALKVNAKLQLLTLNGVFACSLAALP
jgi:hypothetical protein